MATIQDVARLAQVSIATVSRVLNGTAHVEPETSARVLAAAEALHYQASRAARTMRGISSQIIGLLITDIQNPFFTALVRGVEDIAQRHQYSLILCNSDENRRKERQYMEIFCAERVAGTIVVPACEDPRAFRVLRDHHIPVVAIDRRVKDDEIDVVLVDHVRGAREATAHLITNGYHRIGIISGPTTTTSGRERLEGYRQALQEAGLVYDPALVRSGSFKEQSGLVLTRELLAREPSIDALFCANNLMTVGALTALQERQLRTPEDIALVGFDEIPWMAQNKITTVTQAAYDVGSTAALRLFQRIQRPKNAPLTRQEIVLAPTLQARRSSQPHLVAGMGCTRTSVGVSAL